MRIAQIILPDATVYERKCQRVDQAALSERHDVLVVTPEEARMSGADVAHVYAGEALPASAFTRFPLPYVASSSLHPSRWPWRRAVGPREVVTPERVPEAVEERYFAASGARAPRSGHGSIVGSFARPETRNMVEQTLAHIHRFRDDVQWRVFDSPPSPEDLAGVDLWADPAVLEKDYSGFVAEALVIGLPVVATRTLLNARRLEQGRTGLLVPPRDPNEMTHAILALLFKPEITNDKIGAATQTVSKFRARQRLRVLVDMYQTLIG